MAETGKPLDTTAAEAYEKFLVPTLIQTLAQEAIALAAPRPGEKVLDVACGTGIAVRLAAPHVSPGGHVSGLDIDPAMIAVAGSLAPALAGVSVEWRCASGMNMPFDTATFDLVLCIQGLQYLPDAGGGLAEIRRVLKPGGRFLAVVWSSLEECKGQHAIVQAMQRRGIDATPMLKAYTMGDPDRVQKLANGASFRNVETRLGSSKAKFASVKTFVDALAAGGPASRLVLSNVPADQRDGFFQEIDSALRQYENQDGISLPLEYLVLSARP